MAKKKNAKKQRVTPTETVATEPPSSGGGWYAARETIESIVIAFVLAFLFRTFEAEAFVIPTGSMSPSLQGQHKDVCCSECGYRFRTSASEENSDRLLAELARSSRFERARIAANYEVVAGMCPMCRQTVAMRPDLPTNVPAYVNRDGVEYETSYPGDRILVNKYCYNNQDPERWDVVVFKFPGNGEMNYIKRLVGLPNETLRIYQGDIFVSDEQQVAEFQIERKPADKVRAMLQPVHDTHYDPSILYNAGWPLRWTPAEPDGWQVDADAGEKTVSQQFHFKSDSGDAPVSWLRYHNFVPQNDDWIVARKFKETGKYTSIAKQQWLRDVKPELIRDFNAYNAVRLRGQIPQSGWSMPDDRFQMHWVSDLAVQCEVEIEQAQGELHLDLVEAGKHFTCQIDLKTGVATIGVQGSEALSTKVETSVNSAGTYEFVFAHVDDQLLLWINDEAISLSDTGPSWEYDAVEVFGDRKNIFPRAGENDPGDLAPVGIGARGTSLTVNHLQVLRDIYYIATKTTSKFCDYPEFSFATTRPDDGERLPGLQSLRQLFTDPAAWPRFGRRQKVDFKIDDRQLFVMGDNSPASQDCRLWATPNRNTNDSHPGGSYLDRRLLIGKAVCVFWPHSWGGIPGASKLPGFPNFGDMRLVR